MDESLRAVAEGADLWPQVAGRAIRPAVAATSPPTRLFDQVPAYQELKAKGLSPDEFVDALRTPEVRASIESWEPDGRAADRMDQAYRTTFTLGSPPEYEPGPERSLAGIAAATGSVAVAGGLRRHARERRAGPAVRAHPATTPTATSEPAREMLLHPRAAAGLGDGGAHCGVICDAAQPTFMLTHWTRDRDPGRAPPPRVDGEEADPRHGPPLRPRRPGHDRGRGGGRPQPHRLRQPADGQSDRGRRPAGRRQPHRPGRHRATWRPSSPG